MSRKKEVVQRCMDGVRSGLCLLIFAICWIGCANAQPTSPARVVSPPIDRLFIFSRNWPTEEVELALIRDAGQSTLTLYRPARDGRPRIMLDSIGPGQKEPEEFAAMRRIA